MEGREREVAGLTCSQVLARLGEFVDGELSNAEVARLRAHVAGCDRCSTFGARYAAIVAELRRSGTDDLDPAVAGRLRARVAAIEE